MSKREFVIIGGGSAAFAAAVKANDLGVKTTIINDGLPIGGTCVNVGCVPSKTLIRAAEANHRSANSRFKGIESKSRVTDFKAIIQQKRDLVENLRQEKYINVVSNMPNVHVINGRGILLDKNTVTVNGSRIHADKILLAAGVSPLVPSIPGLRESGYFTNENIFDLEELPDSMIILGGRYIALESAQMFARLGTRVTILQRSDRILPSETDDLTSELTHYLTEEGINVVTDVLIKNVSRQGKIFVIDTVVKGVKNKFSASHLLVATGRQPNTRGLGLEEIGVEVDNHGFLKVNEQLETSVPGIFGAGDIIGDPMFVYVAAYEGSLAAENALTEARMTRDYTALPWVIFTDPQLVGVGLDEIQARKNDIDADAVKLPLSAVPRAIAARDTRGFIKLIRNKKTDQLIGARVLAPEGSELLMELSIAVKYHISVSEIRSLFHPYLTLSEGIKLAALAFKRDIHHLSCCAG